MIYSQLLWLVLLFVSVDQVVPQRASVGLGLVFRPQNLPYASVLVCSKLWSIGPINLWFWVAIENSGIEERLFQMREVSFYYWTYRGL